MKAHGLPAFARCHGVPALVLLVLALLVFLMVAPRPARACASCGAGDPTLTAVGTEQPVAGRLRLALAFGYRTEASGVPAQSELRLEEYRTELTLGWAPGADLLLLASVPALERHTTDVALREQRTRGLGDIELRAKQVLLRDRVFAPSHLLGGIVGVKLPTAPLRTSSGGETLPAEAQTGTGSLDALLGLAYTASFRPWSVYLSLELRLPLVTRAALEPGSALRGTAALQRELWTWLSLRAAFDARFETRASERAELVLDSGGTAGFAGADALCNPGLDVTLLAGTRAPVLPGRRCSASSRHSAWPVGRSMSSRTGRTWPAR